MGDRATMSAVVQHRYGAVASEVLSLDRIPVPTPGDGEALVRVRAAGVDRGTAHLMAGRPLVIRPWFGLRGPRQPVPGMDLAGVVEAVGAEGSGLTPGDEVFGIGRGTCAELAVAPVAKLVRRPEHVPWEQAGAATISGITALQAVRHEAEVQGGERVLVLGASGGVGTFAVQIARSAGARVAGVCSGAKADLVSSLGAEDVYDHADDEWMGAGPFDVVLDIGGNNSLRTLRRVLTERGRLVVVGGEGGGPLLGGIDRQMRASMLSPFVRQSLGFFVSKEAKTDIQALGDLLAAGDVVTSIGQVYPLGRTAEAIDEMLAGRARGKLVVMP
ncbi:MAG TPA: NAD(P)-dependent alcohol dehydrogenase [Acidimicrobiales bacterium]